MKPIELEPVQYRDHVLYFTTTEELKQIPNDFPFQKVLLPKVTGIFFDENYKIDHLELTFKYKGVSIFITAKHGSEPGQFLYLHEL
jgi:hypothetical protein